MNARATTISGMLLFLAVLANGCSDGTPPPAAGNAGAATGAVAEHPALSDPAALRDLLDEVIDFTERRYLSPDEHAAWQIMHGVLAYGKGLHVNVNGELVPALDWVMGGGDMRGWTMKPGSHGLEAVVESGTKTGQGHKDQWLAVIAQSGATLDDEIVVRGKTYSVRDLVTQAQWDVRDGMECSWTIIAVSSYLPLDVKWTAVDGGEWTIERMIGMEAAQDLAESACGGSHRLIGMSMALNRYLNENGQLTGGWAAADERIRGAIAAAREYQQPTGAFSTSYFERPSSSPDVAVLINTSGHTLEFLTLALTDEQLAEPWVVRGAVYLCKLFEQTRDLPLECGSLYHAAHALQLYRLRRFGARDLDDESADAPPVAEKAAVDEASGEAVAR